MLTHPNYVSLSYEPHESHQENLIIQTKASPKGLLENVINKFIEIGFVTDVISFGDNKFMVKFINFKFSLYICLINYKFIGCLLLKRIV